ncbi:MAG: heterodisulfide reductase subunit A, partial [Polyangiaceae bacterium]|nr:heterodisulfide reductase subunit A [Polyangiaceae bacterium]
LVVLATGLVPEIHGMDLPVHIERDDHGFLVTDKSKGVVAVGCARAPSDVVRSVQDATAAGVVAMQLSGGR